MTPAETTTILRQFNEWRRDTSNWPPSPMLIEKAIDAAIAMIDRLEAAEKERDALRAKIAEMEQQEPVATVRINAINGNPSVDFVPGHHYLHHNDRLYLAPGAKGE